MYGSFVRWVKIIIIIPLQLFTTSIIKTSTVLLTRKHIFLAIDLDISYVPSRDKINKRHQSENFTDQPYCFPHVFIDTTRMYQC